MEETMHHLTLSQREKLSMTGVQEVLRFDEDGVTLRTPLGTLTVEGEALRLKALTPDGGQMAVEGHIRALFYEEPRQRRRLFGGLT